MNIAILQASFPFSNPMRNAARLLDLARGAAEKGAQLCVAPELSISGVLPGDLLLNPHFTEDCRRALHWLADELAQGGPAVLAGSPMPGAPDAGFSEELACLGSSQIERPRVFNCAVLAQGGEVHIVAAQQHLPPLSNHDFARYFTPGWGSGVFTLGNIRFAAVMGYDALAHAMQWKDTAAGAPWSFTAATATQTGEGEHENANPEADPRPASESGVLICITATPFFGQNGYLFTRGLAELADKIQLPVVFANAVSASGGMVFGGGSALFSRTGAIQATAPRFTEDTLWLKAEKEQGLTPLPGMSSETGRIAVRPLHCDAPVTVLKSKEESTFRALQWGLKRYFEDNNFSRVFLGLSGGLDSALCAVIAATALGAEAVCGVLMPSPHTSRESQDWAALLAKNLGIATRIIPIAQLMAAFDDALAESFAGREKGVAEENLQARIRGTLLMAMSNKFGGMVICPGNKSELAVGYSTLYGDSVGALAVIGDVYKSDAYALANWYNEYAGKEVIPAGIINRPPTAELSPGQRDTDSLPPYHILDAILRQYIEEGLSPGEIRVKGADDALVAKVIRMVRCAEFKRRQSPPVIEVSVRPFGHNWRMPLSAD